ncbi:hypothetical protein [Lysobacter sp. FW306-1B-D06B]|uniref:hypothetical protein n=1 Tax=Lysobacter sp. FW306-1B-D06B TaxID=3140250 RepID=UPI0031407FFA
MTFVACGGRLAGENTVEEAQLLTLYCKASDFDAATGQCVAPFYGPHSTLLPPMSMADASVIAACIGMLWAIGFKIRAARRVTST